MSQGMRNFLDAILNPFGPGVPWWVGILVAVAVGVLSLLIWIAGKVGKSGRD